MGGVGRPIFLFGWLIPRHLRQPVDASCFGSLVASGAKASPRLLFVLAKSCCFVGARMDVRMAARVGVEGLLD